MSQLKTSELSYSELQKYLKKNQIEISVDLGSKKKLLENMARLLCTNIDSEHEKNAYHSLIERERLGSTGIGNGIALPHGRLADIDRPIVAIMVLKEAIDYDSPDKQAVNIAFGLLVPQEATQEHLNILAQISGLMSDNNIKSGFLTSQSADDIIQLINQN